MNGKRVTNSANTMNSQVLARYIFTIVTGLLIWLVVYLVKRKLNNPDFGTEWGGIGVIAFFALVFLFFTVAAWFGVFVENKSIEIDADFVGVRSDTVLTKQDGSKVYRWRLECRWNDPRTGRLISFTSEPFEGTDLYYDRSKIKVSVYPDKPDVFYVVDLSFVTAIRKSGIKLLHENSLNDADRKLQVEQEKKLAHDQDQQIRRQKSQGLAVWLNRIVFAGAALLICIALIVGGLLYFRHRTSQRQTQEFVHATQQAMQAKGWSFSFQPYERPWQGLMGILREDKPEVYPYGLVAINGTTHGHNWTLKVSINRKDIRRYYHSREEYLLMSTNYTSLVLPVSTHQPNSFIALIELPRYFTEKLKSQLTQPFAALDGKFFADFPMDDNQSLMHNYIQILFDESYNVLYKSTETYRSGESVSGTTLVTITNNPKLTDQLLGRDVKSRLKKIGESEKGGYGLLITTGGIVVTTLVPKLNVGEIQEMVDLATSIKMEVITMNSNGNN